MEEIECLDAEMFLKWVKEKTPDDFDEGIRIINENKINGHIFMSLTDRDLKDLFPEFMIRKRIRDLQITEQRAVKKFLERRMYNITPARTNRGRKRKNNENNEHVHQKEQGLTKEKGLPLKLTETTEEEVDTSNQETAEVPLEVAESAHNDAIIISTGADSTDMTEEIITEDRVLKTTDTSKKGRGKSEKVPEQEKIEDRSAQSLDKELRRCSPKTTEKKVEQLLRLTVEYRCSYATTLPKHSRVEDMIGTYPVFKSTDILITNLLATINLEENIISHKLLEKNLKRMSTEILDFVYAKNLTTVPRSALKSEDQQILVAMAQLPLILDKREKGKSVPVPQLVHIVKKDEMWQEITAKHKNSTSPWIMYQRHGDQEIITVMIKQSIIKKASSAVNAVLALMGIYYMAMLPYPSNCSAALLYIQGQVLLDEVHRKDKSVFNKAKEIFENFVLKEVDLFA
ncbi:unnamed protein product [Mytilus coruscus]|uniref:SAM domain-containing protein n=1 Tax=Mytilus coruscus TaxID=42192 RepID=A0A6J8F4N5_MYTCO|nr:unnamed protein product [Mytilus coruscus]